MRGVHQFAFRLNWQFPASDVSDTSYEMLKANRRISNIEPQNVEVWNRFALSLFKLTEYIIRCSLFSFSI